MENSDSPRTCSGGLKRKNSAKTIVNSSNQVGSCISIIWVQIKSHKKPFFGGHKLLPIHSFYIKRLHLCAAFEFNSPWYFDMSLIIYWGLCVDKIRIKLFIVKIWSADIQRCKSFKEKWPHYCTAWSKSMMRGHISSLHNVGWGVLFLASSGTWFMELRNVCPHLKKMVEA